MSGAILGTVISAWLDVRSKPVRTLAAIAGMVAAVMAVIVVDSASRLSQDANNEFIAWQYGRPATVEIRGFPSQEQNSNVSIRPGSGNEGAAPPSVLGPPDSTLGVTLAADAQETLRGNGVAQVSQRYDVRLWFMDGEDLRQSGGTLVSSDYDQIQVIEMVAGMFPEETATSDVIHVVLSERKAAEFGFSPQGALGQILWYSGAANYSNSARPAIDTPLQPMIVDGVGQWAPGTMQGDILLVSDIPRPDLIEQSGISLVAHINPADIGLVDMLFSSWADTQEVTIQDRTVRRSDRLAELAPVLEQQDVTAGAVSVVSLVIGGLGILGVGLASVRERAQDFGLRRAIGSSTTRVFMTVIVQTLMEVLIAAIIAIPLAALTVELFARQLVLGSLPLPANTGMPVSSAVTGLAAALVVGLIAGLLPATRAARASVVQALRG